ncbi:MAG: hypothetical protein ABIP29_08225 [Candidatus Eisenbacteria bacterium]
MRRRVAVAAWAGLALALAAGPAAAATTSAAFPDAGGGTRSIALGGHLVALPTDDHALETNAARLVYGAGSFSAQVDRLDPGLDLWRGRIGVALGIGPSAAEPLQATRPRRMAFGASIAGQGLTLIEGSSYREATFSAGLAWAPTNLGAIGVAARYQRSVSDVPGAEAAGFGVDVGLSFDLSDHFDVALSVKDAFGRTTFENSDDEDRAARLTLGVAGVRHRRWQAELDYVLQHNSTSAVAGGAEFHVVPGVLDLRAGVSREMRGQARIVPSAGAGLSFGAFRMDYAFRFDPDGAFETQHRASLGARF